MDDENRKKPLESTLALGSKTALYVDALEGKYANGKAVKPDRPTMNKCGVPYKAPIEPQP